MYYYKDSNFDLYPITGNMLRWPDTVRREQLLFSMFSNNIYITGRGVQPSVRTGPPSPPAILKRHPPATHHRYRPEDPWQHKLLKRRS